jgi:hypothetical protein
MTLSMTRVILGSVEADGVQAELAAEAAVQKVAVAPGSVEAEGAEAEKVEVAAEGVEKVAVAAAVVTTVVTTVMMEAAVAVGAVEAKEAVQGSVPLQEEEVRVRPPYLEVAVEHRSLYPTDSHSQVALQAEEHED